MEHGEKMYEGKAKILYATEDESLVIQHFKDDASAFNRKKLGTIVEKGPMNNRISSALFAALEEAGVATHFVRRLSDRDMLCKRLDMLEVEVVIRNAVAGSLARRLGMEEGTAIHEPLFELYYKSDELDDPMITEQHARVFGWATGEQLALMRDYALKTNEVMLGFFAERGIRLVDFKLEFGLDVNGKLLLGDEISPDSCRFWEVGTNKKLDKDRFRHDLGDIEDAYKDILARVEAQK
ncbi:MAG: phosphoribosylaminoimidazolesuccinocarboxamide synthase [Myxococcota bacterium]